MTPLFVLLLAAAPVLLISLDGFRHDYTDKFAAKNIAGYIAFWRGVKVGP